MSKTAGKKPAQKIPHLSTHAEFRKKSISYSRLNYKFPDPLRCNKWIEGFLCFKALLSLRINQKFLLSPSKRKFF